MGASVGCLPLVHDAPYWFALSQGGAFREDETPAGDQTAGVVLPCSAVTTQPDRGLNACLCVAEYGDTVESRRESADVVRGLLSRRGFDWSDFLVLNVAAAVVVLGALLVAAHFVPYVVLVRDWGVSGWFVAGVVLCLADLSAGLWLLKRGLTVGRSERIAGLLDDIDRQLGVIADALESYESSISGENTGAARKRRASSRDKCSYAFDGLLESCRQLANLHHNSLQLIEDDQNGKRLDAFLYLEEALPGTIEGHQLMAHRDLGLSKLRKRRLKARMTCGLKR